MPQQGHTPLLAMPQNVDILRPEDEDTKRILKREDERQKLFDKVSNDVLDIPNGYRKVEVLIVRWDEVIDEFKLHGKEVERLRNIFENKFHYGCQVVTLRNDDDPQLYLDHCIMSHVLAHNGENNLLIIYYTGHGNRSDDGRLRLSANRDWDECMGGHRPIAFWDQAEKPLKTNAKGDVLAILDCCFASTAGIKDSTDEWRTYQLLAASAVEGKTTGPGRGSFTEALCDSLEQLLKESTDGTFSVFKLEETINTKRAEKAALMWDRLKKHKRSVELGPLIKDSKRDATYQNKQPERASLNLRFSLTSDDITNSQINKLARGFPKVCKDAGVRVRQIKWVGMEKRDPHRALRQAAHEWRRRASYRNRNASKVRKETEAPEGKKRSISRSASLSPIKRKVRDGAYVPEEALDMGIRTPSVSSAKSRSATSDEE